VKKVNREGNLVVTHFARSWFDLAHHERAGSTAAVRPELLSKGERQFSPSNAKMSHHWEFAPVDISATKL